MTPFLTIYTPTFRRPQGLARCLASVGGQSAAADIEQIVVVDHVGLGVGGMFARVPYYVDAVHGRYVTILGDDDLLAGSRAVEDLRTFAEEHNEPPLIVVRTRKGGLEWPAPPGWPPVFQQIDLNCLVVRRDVWKAHVGFYGLRYEGDFDFAQALHADGVQAAIYPRLLSVGGVGRGYPE